MTPKRHRQRTKPPAGSTETLRFQALRALADECRAAAGRENLKLQQWLLLAAKERLERARGAALQAAPNDQPAATAAA